MLPAIDANTGAFHFPRSKMGPAPQRFSGFKGSKIAATLGLDLLLMST
jgi:hypothetical protein